MGELSERIRQHIDRISKAGPNPGHIEAERAQIDAILVEELSKQLSQLSTSIFDVQKILGTRIQELSGEMSQTRQEMSRASETATEQTTALVIWTRRLVLVTVLYTLITGCLLAVTWLKSP